MASMALCAMLDCSSIAKNKISRVFFIFELASVKLNLLYIEVLWRRSALRH